MFHAASFELLLSLLVALGSLPGGHSIQAPNSPSDPQDIKIFLPQQQLPAPNPFGRANEPVAFSAVHASSQSRRSVSKILFDRTITDIGYGWYADRSEFICFYPGVYFFTFSALSTPTSQLKVSMMRNNDEVVSTWGEQTGYHAGSNSIILTLNKNDRVYLNIQQGMIHESRDKSRGYTSFSGFRIN